MSEVSVVDRLYEKRRKRGDEYWDGIMKIQERLGEDSISETERRKLLSQKDNLWQRFLSLSDLL